VRGGWGWRGVCQRCPDGPHAHARTRA
jgi:hypothetical protein